MNIIVLKQRGFTLSKQRGFTAGKQRDFTAGKRRGFTAGKQRGFTLLEMVLALSIFSLILLVTYQVLVSSAQSKLRVSQEVNRQYQLRSAHHTLSNAFETKARIKGDRHRIEFDLSAGDSTWLDGARWLTLVIRDDQSLWASIDSDKDASRILDSASGAEFRYLKDEVSHSKWQAVRPPHAVEFSWFSGGEPRRWRFELR